MQSFNHLRMRVLKSLRYLAVGLSCGLYSCYCRARAGTVGRVSGRIREWLRVSSLMSAPIVLVRLRGIFRYNGIGKELQ